MTAMLDTSSRLVRLLSLLQARRFWPGPALAEALEITPRTLRRDVDRLRRLGYPVESSGGVAGGYRLGAGARLPPLMLEEEEALALAVALQAASGSLAGMEGAALRALGKLDQVLPSALRRRLEGMRRSILRLEGGGGAATFEAVRALSEACDERAVVRFSYRGREKEPSRRSVEPHRIVCLGKRWYLVAWDLDREDWRTFRVDRIASAIEKGEPFAPRIPPDADVETYLTRSVAIAAYRMEIVVRLFGPFSELRGKISPAWGLLEEVEEGVCRLRTGANSPEAAAVWLASMGVDFEVEEGAEFAAHLGSVAERLRRAVAATESGKRFREEHATTGLPSRDDSE